MKLNEYENELLNCTVEKSESIFQGIVDRYEDDLLEFDDYPEDYFNFFLNLLSDKRIFNKPGVWNFLLVVGTEGHKLSPDHYERIGLCILDNYINYLDEDLCLAVCDFIARNYDYNRAEELLLALKKIEERKTEKGFANDGLRILNNEIKRKAKPGSQKN